MAKKTIEPKRSRGRQRVHDNYAFFDAWLESGMGKLKWSELNAEKYRTTPRALLKQLHRRQRELDELS